MASKPPELRFIVKTGVEQVGSEERQAIRSHFMKGRNLGKELPLGSRWRRKQLAGVKDDRSPNSSRRHDLASSQDASSADTTRTSEYPCIHNPPPTIPRSCGSVSSTMCLADSVSPGLIETVLKFSSISKQLLFPMERCMLFERRAENWIAPLAVDSAFLHAKIFTSLYYFDVILPRSALPPSQRVTRHHHKALSLLRERLLGDRDDARLSDNTVSVVLGLAGQSFWIGDINSAMKHMQGIRQIVKLRGGLDTFISNEKLAVEILRCDLGIAAYTGSNPVFFDRLTSPYPNLTGFLDNRMNLPSETTNHIRRAGGSRNPMLGLTRDGGELAVVWTAMSDFCSVINLAHASEQRITVGTFLESMAAIMYRLVRMQHREDSTLLGETIRLGLLCFACTVFLHWHRLGVPYAHLASAFRSAITRAASPDALAGASPQLTLWLLAAGAVSVFDAPADAVWLYPLLRGAMEACGTMSWREVRKLLTSFMWIGLVHDKKGEAVFDSAVHWL